MADVEMQQSGHGERAEKNDAGEGDGTNVKEEPKGEEDEEVELETKGLAEQTEDVEVGGDETAEDATEDPGEEIPEGDEDDEGGDETRVTPSNLPDENKKEDSPYTKKERMSRVPYKSYRKKYRKMRLKFEEVMAKANENFVRENLRWDVAKRLKEENDQLLDIMTDLILENNSASIESIEDARSVIARRLPSSEHNRDITHTPYNLPNDSDLPDDLLELEQTDPDDSLIDTREKDVGKDHGLPPLTTKAYCNFDPTYPTPPAYLTPEHEDSYLAELDASLSAVPSTNNLPSGVEAVNPKPPPFRHVQITEEDFQMRCPVSVHNWLRRNRPEIFDQVKDRDKNKDDRDGWEGDVVKTRKYTKKQKTVSKQDQPFAILDDEIDFDPTYDPPTLGSGRGKKRKDDEAYRPKGGHNRGGKRKRDKDDGEGRAKTGKRAKTSGVGLADGAS